MSDTRPRAIGILLCVLVVTSGCVGVLTGSEPFVATASPASVSDDALSETDYQLGESDAMWLNESVDLGGQEREIRIQNHLATYERPAGIAGDGSVTFGMFAVVSTPKASVAGQGLNPIGRLPRQQLIEQVAGQSGSFRDVEEEDSRTLTVLGSDAEIDTYSAVAEESGQEVPVTIEVTRVEDGDDYVVAVGVYPADSEDGRSQVTTLFEGLEH